VTSAPWLGKTIEAGLIWLELEQRTHMTRVLVVCPASLVPKWQTEMKRRFDRDVEVLDRLGMKKLIELFNEADDDKPVFGVVSLERLRSQKVLEDRTHDREGARCLPARVPSRRVRGSSASVVPKRIDA
jgi:SNF2 family DNA or RNA helicase